MTQSVAGIYRQPSVYGGEVVFCSEDRLWTVPLEGGTARQLTSGHSTASYPAFSPDGATIAFTGVEEGNREAYVMSAFGGPTRRLTYLGASTLVVGWTPDGHSVLVCSNHAQPFERLYAAWAVRLDTGHATPICDGPAAWYAESPDGGKLLVRHVEDISRWKRYRGGRVGALWVDPDGSGDYRRIAQTGGNVGRALWYRGQVIFISDHEGTANLYRCGPDGDGMTRLTDHDGFYVRGPSISGDTLVYSCGADLWRLDLSDGSNAPLEFAFPSPRPDLVRRYVDPGRFLDGYAIHPDGDRFAVSTRGKLFSAGLWEGGAVQLGERFGIRQRLLGYMPDGHSLLVVTDANGRDQLAKIPLARGASPEILDDLDVGRPVDVAIAPSGARLGVTNHRNELLWVDLEQRTCTLVERSEHGSFAGMDWSADSRWLAYASPVSREITQIKIAGADDPAAPRQVTYPEFKESSPTFDPQGGTLTFLSCREFDPVYEFVQLQLGFPRSMRVCLVTLRPDVPDPFTPGPRPVHGKANSGDNAKNHRKKGSVQEIEIDFDGIEERVLAYPLREGRFESAVASATHIYYMSLPIKGSKDRDWRKADPPTDAILRAFSFETLETEELATKVSSFSLSPDGKSIIYRSARRLRAIAATRDKKNGGESPGRKSGWIDLKRLSVAVDPASEWRQMLREGWRLMADHYWHPDMGGVDWQEVWERYEPLVARVGTRSELSDIMWRMHGELGTSHAYELGGDHPVNPQHRRGFLGADLEPCETGYRIRQIVRGDQWSRLSGSPLGRAGNDVRPGDVIEAVDGIPVGPETSVAQTLVNRCGEWVELDIRRPGDDAARRITVKTLKSERKARYRQWVKDQRDMVHSATNGRAGYVHIPNMGPVGFAEFHRSYLAEIRRPALVIDVRYNGGGHVSQLLIEKLARRRIAYCQPRYGAPLPYPGRSVMGPVVVLTNEYAGSDGDIFTHAIKLLGLGPVVGSRTWGGVIGVLPRYRLVDKSLVTQPEYSYWFEDVGWGVENHGTVPDIEVEITPADWRQGRDPQMLRAIEEIGRALDESPPALPAFGPPPDLVAPEIPDR